MSNSGNLPLVSILAANYNNAPYVLESLESIKQQTYPNLELIIIDDASADNSPELILEWLKTANITHKYIVHEKNKGLCSTCNELLRNANGKYISFIATDDRFLPEKITKQVNILENCSDNVALVYSDTYLMDSESKFRFGTFMATLCKYDFEYPPSGNVLPYLENSHFLHWLSALARKDVYNTVGYYDESLAFEDYDMSLRIAKKFEIQYMPDIQTVYRVHSKSMSRQVIDWQIYLLPLYLKHLDIPRFREHAAEAVVSAYLKKNKDTYKWLERYNSLTGEKIKYQGWIKAGISPFILRQYLKGQHFLGRLTKKLK
jgi:glycosyltransferase involved in cell wall biosynthesis